jgi:type IV pilus assembly protein PilM
MPTFFSSLFKGAESYIGIDIGTTSIKVVEILHPPGGAKPMLRAYGWLETYGYLERFNNALQTSNLKLFEQEVAGYLRLLIGRIESKAEAAIASLPAFSAFSTLIELPMMSPADVGQTMAYQAKKFIPLPLSTVTIDWLKAGERVDESGNQLQQIFLISIPNEHIERHKNIFKAAGLKLVGIEVEGVSLARALTQGISQAVLIIDIGARSTSFSVAKEGYLKMAGQSDFAGGSITQSIASGLNVTPRRAEDLKKQRGLLVGAGEYELSTLILPMVDVIISEARRIKNNYESSYREQVERVILSGGGANLSGIDRYFQEQIGLPVELANPFKNLSYPGEIESVIKDIGPALSVVIGLGLKGKM